MKRYRTGYTLVEILVVLSIMVLLMAIILPILAQAKKRSYEASDISNLHQLGVAFALYNEQTGDYPSSFEGLVSISPLPPQIFASGVDHTANGWANELATAYNPEAVTKNKQSYPALWDLQQSTATLHERILNEPNPGWILGLSRVTAEDITSPGTWKGYYHRGLMDTSVSTRPIRHEELRIANDHILEGVYVTAFFCDPDKETLDKWVSG